MTHSPFFLKTLETCFKESLEIPMWGKTPEFPWESFQKHLRDIFEQDDVFVECLESDWKNAHSLKEGLSDDPLIFSFTMSPLSAPFYLLIASEDIQALSKVLLDKDGKRTFTDAIYQSGFSQFILLHILKEFHEISPYQDLKVRLSSKPFAPENAYCVDVMMKIAYESLLCRFAFPESFHRIVTSHFSSKTPPLHRLDSSLEIPLSLYIGNVCLSQSEWNSVKVGDCVVLDECSYHPKQDQGTFFLSIASQRLFVLKRKHSEIKILDYALYNFNSLEDEDTVSMDIEDNDDEEGIEFEEPENEGSEEAITEQVISSQEIPLTLCVEIGKVRMPLKELLALKPGNTLALGHTLDQHVYLTLNSKVVAKGQLIQLGELVGVKIGEIAH